MTWQPGDFISLVPRIVGWTSPFSNPVTDISLGIFRAFVSFVQLKMQTGYGRLYYLPLCSWEELALQGKMAGYFWKVMNVPMLESLAHLPAPLPLQPLLSHLKSVLPPCTAASGEYFQLKSPMFCIQHIKAKTKQKQNNHKTVDFSTSSTVPLGPIFRVPVSVQPLAAVDLGLDPTSFRSSVAFSFHSWILCLLPRDADLVQCTFLLTLLAQQPGITLQPRFQILPFSRHHLPFITVYHFLSFF